MINTDSLPITLVLSGTPFTVIAIDGTDLNAPTALTGQRLLVAAGGRYDIQFTMPATAVSLDWMNKLDKRKAAKNTIALCQGMRSTWLLTRGLEGPARVVCAQGNFSRAATLQAAAEEQRTALGAVVVPTIRADYNHMLSVLGTSLSSQAFEEAWRFGSSMSAEQSMAYALGNDAVFLHGGRLSDDSGEHAHE